MHGLPFWRFCALFHCEAIVATEDWIEETLALRMVKGLRNGRRSRQDQGWQTVSAMSTAPPASVSRPEPLMMEAGRVVDDQTTLLSLATAHPVIEAAKGAAAPTRAPAREARLLVLVLLA